MLKCNCTIRSYAASRPASAAWSGGASRCAGRGGSSSCGPRPGSSERIGSTVCAGSLWELVWPPPAPPAARPSPARVGAVCWARTTLGTSTRCGASLRPFAGQARGRRSPCNHQSGQRTLAVKRRRATKLMQTNLQLQLQPMLLQLLLLLLLLLLPLPLQALLALMLRLRAAAAALRRGGAAGSRPTCSRRCRPPGGSRRGVRRTTCA